MRSPWRDAIGAVLLLLGIAVVTCTAEAETPPLPLNAAIRRALEQNHMLRASTHAAQASIWDLREARARLLPSVALQSSYTRLDDETVERANAFGREITMYVRDSTDSLQPVTITIPQSVFRDGYETSISANLALLNPSVWNAVSMASASRGMARGELEGDRQETIYQTLRAFVELLKIHSMVEIQLEYVHLARGNREQAERLLQVGRYAEADVLRWKVEEISQNQLLIEQESARRVAALQLEHWMGDPPTGATRPDTLLPESVAGEISRIRSLSDEGWQRFLQSPLDPLIEGNPQVAVLHHSVDLAKLSHRQSKYAFLPGISIGGTYGWQQNDTVDFDGEKAWSVQAVFTMPLFTSLANRSAYQATKHRLAASRQTRDDARRQILLQAEAARTSIRSFAEQLRLAEASLESAQRNYEIRENSFHLGRLSNLEWIDALLSLRAAEQSRTAAYYDLILAVAEYEWSLGRIHGVAGV